MRGGTIESNHRARRLSHARGNAMFFDRMDLGVI